MNTVKNAAVTANFKPFRNFQDLMSRWNRIDSMRRINRSSPAFVSYDAVKMICDLMQAPDKRYADKFRGILIFIHRYELEFKFGPTPVRIQTWLRPYFRYFYDLSAYLLQNPDNFFLSPSNDSFEYRFKEALRQEDSVIDIAAYFWNMKQLLDTFLNCDDKGNLPKQIADELSRLAETGVLKEVDNDAFFRWERLMNIDDPDESFNPWNLNAVSAEELDKYEDYHGINTFRSNSCFIRRLMPWIDFVNAYMGFCISLDCLGETNIQEQLKIWLKNPVICKNPTISRIGALLMLFKETMPSPDMFELAKTFLDNRSNLFDFKNVLEKANFSYILSCDLWNFSIQEQTRMVEAMPAGENKRDILQKLIDAVENPPKHLPHTSYSGLLVHLKGISIEVERNLSRQRENIVRNEERKQVLMEMSHTIKNLLASVSDPLSLLKEELEGKQRRTVERALDGVSLIQILALGVHMSMRGNPGDWRKDIVSAGGDGTSLQGIFEQALRQSVVNMFHGKYFARFSNAYFEGSLDKYLAAQTAWETADSWERLKNCLQEHFFDFDFAADADCTKIFLTDTTGAKTQLLLMLQELCLNAVKNAALMPRAQRWFRIHCAFAQGVLTISLQNSALSGPPEHCSGLGLPIIKQFAELFEAEYQHGFVDSVYTTNLKFTFAKEA